MTGVSARVAGGGWLHGYDRRARQRLAAGQGELDLGLADGPEAGGPLEITGSRMGHLWDALCRGYEALGFDEAAGRDEVFRQLVLARIMIGLTPALAGMVEGDLGKLAPCTAGQPSVLQDLCRSRRINPMAVYLVTAESKIRPPYTTSVDATRPGAPAEPLMKVLRYAVRRMVCAAPSARSPQPG